MEIPYLLERLRFYIVIDYFGMNPMI